MEESILIKSQKKKGKEPNGIAAITMALVPYIFWTVTILLLEIGIDINAGINLLLSLVISATIICCFLETIRGLIKSKNKVLFIPALVLNFISSGLIVIYILTRM